MSSDYIFRKENIDFYLKELAKDFIKLNGKTTPAEIVIVGGASILINYGFRDATQDIDAVYRASSAMKDAIHRTGDRLNLPNGWLNQDFRNVSEGVEGKLIAHSKHYRTFNRILEIRTVSDEYLIAMKLKSGRQYKNDLSDVAGIILEKSKENAPIPFDAIDNAVCELYGSWDSLDADVVADFKGLYSLSTEELAERYKYLKKQELSNKDALVSFEKVYPGTLNKENLKEIVENLKKPSVLSALKEKQTQIEMDNSAHEEVSYDDR